MKKTKRLTQAALLLFIRLNLASEAEETEAIAMYYKGWNQEPEKENKKRILQLKIYNILHEEYKAFNKAIINNDRIREKLLAFTGWKNSDFENYKNKNLGSLQDALEEESRWHLLKALEKKQPKRKKIPKTAREIFAKFKGNDRLTDTDIEAYLNAEWDNCKSENELIGREVYRWEKEAFRIAVRKGTIAGYAIEPEDYSMYQHLCFKDEIREAIEKAIEQTIMESGKIAGAVLKKLQGITSKHFNKRKLLSESEILKQYNLEFED